jgi:L-threonylcarbamoyladenylate synthase
MAVKIVDLQEASAGDLARCRDIIRSGGVIGYPTDTFYGLGADPANAAAVRRIFVIKGRNPDRPVIVLLPDRSRVPEWAAEVPQSAERLMDRFWPGPLTLVYRAGPRVLPELTGGSGTIGLRVPGNQATRELLGALGTALTGTSANLSGGANPRTADEVLRELGDRVDLVIDGGVSAEELPSTVVDVTMDPPRVVRQGVIDIQQNPPTKEGL